MTQRGAMLAESLAIEREAGDRLGRPATSKCVRGWPLQRVARRAPPACTRAQACSASRWAVDAFEVGWPDPEP